MFKQNEFPYEIIQEKDVSVPIVEASKIKGCRRCMGIYLCVISDGENVGLARRHEAYPFEHNESDWYSVLIECKYDHIKILDTYYGVYVVVYFKDKCCLCHIYPSGEFSIGVQNCIRFCNDIEYQPSECKKILIIKYKDYEEYYDLKKQCISEWYDWIEPIDDEFIECLKNERVKIIGIGNEILFPQISEADRIVFACKYKDGCVYRVYTNRNCNNPKGAYLIFYSKRDKVFYKTDICDQINILGFSEWGKCFYMSGFEGIENEKINTYTSSNKIWTDEDMKSAPNIQIIK